MNTARRKCKRCNYSGDETETRKKPAKGTAKPNEDGEEEKDNENYHRKVRHRPRLNFRLFCLSAVHLICSKKYERRKNRKKYKNKRNTNKKYKKIKLRKNLPAGSL